ncbi:hypothetical protein F4810DRAFT_668046 [Camillea tinctor]|nr:hypothetical protein F4810DRAFT_668046 [Camillea tinctor]
MSADDVSMRIFIDWVYARNRLGSTPDVFDKWISTKLIKSWILGCHLRAPMFQNDLMRNLHARGCHGLCMPAVDFAVRNLDNGPIPADSMLYRFLVRLIAYYLSTDYLGEDRRKEVLRKLNTDNAYEIIMCFVGHITYTEQGNKPEGNFPGNIFGSVDEFLVKE